MMRCARYGGTLVEVYVDCVRVVLPDGKAFYARPNHGAEDIARAYSLGYSGDVFAMTREHDPLHARFAYAIGLQESPALRCAADGTESILAGLEEEMILAAQRFINECRKEGLLP